MGAVYCIEDAQIANQRWALKELSNAVVGPVERRQAELDFARESAMLRGLAHPNLPRVVDAFDEGDRHYIVMDFIDGMTLGQLLEQRGQPFDEGEVVRWAGQLCSALDYLHQRSPPIIFRDLKPDNIMLDHLGRIFLIDFGIARHFAPGKTADTRQLGTYGYAAPEQFGHGQTDALSDVYSLGVTLHHLLTGQPPPHAGALPDVATLRTDLSLGAAEAIRRATRITRAERWPSAGALYQALARDGSPTIRPAHMPAPIRSEGGAPPTRVLTDYLRQLTADWTTQQLVSAVLALTVASVLMVAILAPWVRDNLPLVWFNFPAYALPILAFHAATRTNRMAFAAAAHMLVAGASMLMASSALGRPMDIGRLIIALTVSGVVALAVIEIPARYDGSEQPWRQRALLSALAGALTATSFIPLYFGSLRAGQIVGGLLAGVVGWIVGDLVYQWRVSSTVAGP